MGMKIFVTLIVTWLASLAGAAAAAEGTQPALPDPAYCSQRDADPEKCVIQDGPPPKPIVRKKPPPPQKPPVLEKPATKP